jgi:hypothetical protein
MQPPFSCDYDSNIELGTECSSTATCKAHLFILPASGLQIEVIGAASVVTRDGPRIPSVDMNVLFRGISNSQERRVT